MNILFSFITSLLLTTLVSFAAPIIIIIVLFAFLTVASHVSFMGIYADECYRQLWSFLMMFGEGSGTNGILTISVVAGIAGLLFESLNFYRFQILFNHRESHGWLTKSESVKILHNSINR